MNIVAREVPPRAAWALEQAGVHPLLARLFAARGVQSHDELDDGLARLLPPAGLKGIDAAARLLAALNDKANYPWAANQVPMRGQISRLAGRDSKMRACV